MRRKQEPDALKKKLTQKQQSFDYSCDTEISILLPYLRMMPITMHSRFVLALKQAMEKQPVSQLNRSFIERLLSTSSIQAIDIGKQGFIFELFCRFLKLNKLKQYSLNLPKKSVSRDKQQENYEKDPTNITLMPFEPNIQKQVTKFQPMPQVINPNYQNIIKMYKTFTDIHVSMEYKIKDLNEGYTFFAQPRFIQKLLQKHDFQSQFSQKGNIMMMSFEGSKIVGKRGFAFLHNNAIYWWQKNYKDIKDLLPQINEDKQKQQKDKDKNKRKQIQKQQSKNQQPEAPRLTQNFKLSYKLIGHHGKITSISLSDDQFYLISAGTDKTIKLWCLRQKCLLAEYRGHLKTIWSLSFNKSGYFFLSGSADKTIKLWATDDSIPQRIYVGHQDDVTKVDFLKNPDLMVSASEDKTIRIWNTLTTQCLNIFKLDRSPINFKASISGRYFASCDSAGKLTFYDLLKGQIISSFKIPQKQQPNQRTIKYLKIHDMCFSMDEKQFSCVSSKYIIIYSLDKVLQRQSKSLFTQTGRDSMQRAVATKEVIYTGRDTNLVYCDYHDKGILLVASTTIKKY